MKEYNRDSLRRALDQLPQYDPEPSTWEGIARDLAEPRADALSSTPQLQQRLPQYSPPPSVWNQINEQLNRSDATTRLQRTPLPRRLPTAFWRAAAAVALLVGAFALYQSFEQGPEISYSYRKETNFEPTLVADWRDEEPQFRSLAEEIADSDNPTVNRLRGELKELTAARGDLESMLENYGHDPHLVRRLGEIERERSEVYRQLIVYR